MLAQSVLTVNLEAGDSPIPQMWAKRQRVSDYLSRSQPIKVQSRVSGSWIDSLEGYTSKGLSVCLSVCFGNFSILKFSPWFEILGLSPIFVR